MPIHSLNLRCTGNEDTLDDCWQSGKKSFIAYQGLPSVPRSDKTQKTVTLKRKAKYDLDKEEEQRLLKKTILGLTGCVGATKDTQNNNKNEWTVLIDSSFQKPKEKEVRKVDQEMTISPNDQQAIFWDASGRLLSQKYGEWSTLQLENRQAMKISQDEVDSVSTHMTLEDCNHGMDLKITCTIPRNYNTTKSNNISLKENLRLVSINRNIPIWSTLSPNLFTSDSFSITTFKDPYKKDNIKFTANPTLVRLRPDSNFTTNFFIHNQNGQKYLFPIQ